MGLAVVGQNYSNPTSSTGLRPEVLLAAKVMTYDRAESTYVLTSAYSFTNAANVFVGSVSGTISGTFAGTGLSTNIVGTNGLTYWFTNGVLRAIQ